MVPEGTDRLRWLIDRGFAVMRMHVRPNDPEPFLKRDEHYMNNRETLLDALQHDLFKSCDRKVFDVYSDEDLMWQAIDVGPVVARVRVESALVILMTCVESYARWCTEQCLKSVNSPNKWRVLHDDEWGWANSPSIKCAYILPKELSVVIDHVANRGFHKLLRECIINFDLPIKYMLQHARVADCGWFTRNDIVHNGGVISEKHSAHCVVHKSSVEQRVDLRGGRLMGVICGVLSFAALFEQYQRLKGRIN